MQCPNGHEMTNEQSFCPYCGAPRPVVNVESPLGDTQALPAVSIAAETAGDISGRRRLRDLPRRTKWSAAVLAVLLIALTAGGIAYAVNSSSTTKRSGAAAGSPTTSTTAPTGQPASTQPGVGSWICKFGDGSAMFFQWPTGTTSIDGSYQIATLTGTSPNQQVSTNTQSFTGTDEGNQITLALGTETVYGSLSNGHLALNLPQQDGTIGTEDCTASSTAGWNQTIAQMGGQVSAGNQAAATQQQDANDSQKLQSALANLQSDAAALNQNTGLGSDVTTAKSDLTTAQKDYQAEQTDDCSTMSSDAATVASDLATVQSDQASEQSDVTSLNDSISSLKQDISTAQSAASAVASDGGSASSDLQSSIASADQAIHQANANIASANQQLQQLVDAAQQVSTEAANYASAHGC